MKPQPTSQCQPFDAAEKAFFGLIDRLSDADVMSMTHGEVETVLGEEGREVLRLMFQAHLDQRGPGDVGPAVVGADGVARTHKRMLTRQLRTLFGDVEVARLGYGAPGVESLFPLDAALNLPPEVYSHGVQRRVAESASMESFDDTVADLERTTGAAVPKRQAERIAARAAVDFDDFYQDREARGAADPEASGIVVITADGKGVVMRHDSLRDETRKAAEKRQHKMKRRLSRGEKRNCKRMSTVAAVYTIAPQVRTPDDIVHELERQATEPAIKRRKPESKRVWASLEKAPAQVIEEAFSEARRRDPDLTRDWVAVVDGNNVQIAELQKAAKRHGVQLTLILDLIHATEYLWRAARALHEDESAPETEAWVTERVHRILEGKSSDVAAGMTRSATRRGMSAADRKPVDACARYLLNKRELMRYDEYLARGFPIGTGVIEGACRHLVKDRMDITGARWSLAGAEAVLRLRSIRSSHDFDAYWRFHEEIERASYHDVRYAGGTAPVIPPPPPRHKRPALKLVG